jgi:hypothetical protein
MGMCPSGEGSTGGAGRRGFDPPSRTWPPVKAAPNGAFQIKTTKETSFWN